MIFGYKSHKKHEENKRFIMANYFLYLVYIFISSDMMKKKMKEDTMMKSSSKKEFSMKYMNILYFMGFV